MTPIASWWDDFTPGPGGVMTEEVGVITGELTLRTDLHHDGRIVLNIQYKDADEWYVVEGGRCRLPEPDPLRGEQYHQRALEVLARGGAATGLEVCERFT
ncbi:hypothetical protein C3Y87_06500 [Carbonactinospora thermoautotrophica]|uniref:Uncharacterized protein n=1 Tax=Carbonactinospora thermoautotrophica TaxID=1469144 RepID=A0A132MQ13_9ACTN|nr:hypothetical protein [Carbonactinospora thermoautotrophica]KWW99956.1 hypothetical protein LI90_1596 [Carbonactinospora thermoautotrophica]MCX9191065.1 hypothetical protein [Carbonactinospora thermoautotrophica]